MNTKARPSRWRLITADWKPTLLIALPIFAAAMWFGISRRYSDLGLYAILVAAAAWHIADMAVLCYRKIGKLRNRPKDSQT
ncbi:MAG: hypothetical protein C5B50_27510 [Verrucomicrobia bacterium]|nr:MAG: hypothetical protein C5B50_27510 [Verrucomicrobiota bacterium]